jgi:hypothetical protein
MWVQGLTRVPAASVGWLQRKWAWAKLNRLAWAYLGLLLCTVAAASLSAKLVTDLPLRLWAVALQIMGAVTVWIDLRRKAVGHGVPGFLRFTLDWLKAFRGRNIVLSVKTGQLNITAGNARLIQRRPIRPDVSIEERVSAAEYNIAQIDSDLTAAHKRIDAEERERRDGLKAERDARAVAVEGLQSRMKDEAVGNFYLLGFGLVWLIVGIALATLAPEVLIGARWLIGG